MPVPFASVAECALTCVVRLVNTLPSCVLSVGTFQTRMQRPDRAEFARLATPERIDRLRALRAARNAEMDKRLDATKSFYAALSSEQKAVFDAVGMRYLGGGKGGHGFGGRDGHRGGHHRHHG